MDLDARRSDDIESSYDPADRSETDWYAAISTKEHLITEPQSFVTHLECGETGERFEPGLVHGLSSVGKPLLAKYDLDGLRSSVSRAEVAGRPSGMWRYREFLPMSDPEGVVTLGEPETPLVALESSGAKLKATAPLVKDEGRLPTGSFKARGLAMAVTMAKELGLTRLAMPTNGNAGAALAAYGTRAGIETYVFCPDNTPEINVREIALQGAKVWRVNGLINDCGKIVAAGKEAMGWFDVSTLKEPYRIEGKKTMGLELADQLGWQLPDVIFYPTGGGTGLIGMWKAFKELREVGWLTGPLPRMVAVQSTGCAPIVRAYDRGDRYAELWEGASTIASGIRVPAAIGDFLILDAVTESGGYAVAVEDEAIIEARRTVAQKDGLLLCPEGAATYAAWQQGVEDGSISRTDRAVLFNCGNGIKYPMPEVAETLDHTAVANWSSSDWEVFASA
jgi:threonine synthase